jgi:single-strand DNA-binding protein
VAINRRRKNGDQWEDEANFFDIVVWGRQGESLAQYLLKGKQVGIDGELRQDRWQQQEGPDGQKGQSRSKVEIVANNIQLLGGSGGSNGPGNQSFSQPKNGENSSPPSDDNFTDDIPF